jgi:hypothetical protein
MPEIVREARPPVEATRNGMGPLHGQVVHRPHRVPCSRGRLTSKVAVVHDASAVLQRVSGVNYLGRPATIILAGGGGKF